MDLIARLKIINIGCLGTKLCGIKSGPVLWVVFIAYNLSRTKTVQDVVYIIILLYFQGIA